MVYLASLLGAKTAYQSREIKSLSSLSKSSDEDGLHPTETPHRQSGCKEHVGVIEHQHSSIFFVIRCQNRGRLPQNMLLSQGLYILVHIMLCFLVILSLVFFLPIQFPITKRKDEVKQRITLL